MITKEIKSFKHPIVKHLKNLRKSRKMRLAASSLFIEGKKLVTEVGNKMPLKKLILKQGESPPPFIKYETLYFVTEAILQKISGTPSPEPIAAEAPLPPQGDLSHKRLLLGLDSITDPGNLGTLLRTALALNFEGAFITKSCVDPFNEKAIRAAKGATFRLPLQIAPAEELQTLIQNNCLRLYYGDLHGTPLDTTSFTPPLILILSSEAHGPSNIIKRLGQPITIPISKEMESLNVAIAGGILLYRISYTQNTSKVGIWANWKAFAIRRL